MRRSAMITASHVRGQDNGVTVTLGMSDGVSDVISMQLLIPDEELANEIEKNFRADAEGIYNRIIAILTQN